jgi:hypothetical protein
MTDRLTCATYRDELMDLVDRWEIRPGTARALEHVGRCGTCAGELQGAALTIVGLRRLYDEVSRLEPAADTWDRVRSRVTRRRTATYGLGSPILGIVVAWSLVAAVGFQFLTFDVGLDRGHSPSAITARDAFEPTVRLVSLDGGTASSTVKPMIRDGDVTGSRAEVIAAHARRVSNA